MCVGFILLVVLSEGGRAIMKTTCPPGYHHNDFEATHALANKNRMYGYTLLVPMNQRVLIYIMLILLL